MAEFDINTPARQAAFIAQISLESGECRYVVELASGDAYEGRKDLGNTQPGDGRRYKGRGLIQLTGRANYAKLAKYFGVDFVANPKLLETPEWAARSACWFWKNGNGNLNVMADAGNFEAITRRINGGLNGLAERVKYWDRAKIVLAGATPVVTVTADPGDDVQTLTMAPAPTREKAKSIVTGQTAVISGTGIAAGVGAIADQSANITAALSGTTAAVGAAKGFWSTMGAIFGGPALPWVLVAICVLALVYVLGRHWWKVRRGDVQVR